MGQAKYQRDGDPRTSGPGFGVTVHEDALAEPLRWRKPRKVFVNSMSDPSGGVMILKFGSPQVNRYRCRLRPVRQVSRPGHPFEQGFDVRLWPERLTLPLRWRKPRRVFLNSMSDLWHEAVGADLIAQVFAVIAVAEQHTFQVLTKRPGRMHSLLGDDAFWDQVGKAVGLYDPSAEAMAAIEGRSLPNLWLGSRWRRRSGCRSGSVSSPPRRWRRCGSPAASRCWVSSTSAGG